MSLRVPFPPQGPLRLGGVGGGGEEGKGGRGGGEEGKGRRGWGEGSGGERGKGR